MLSVNHIQRFFDSGRHTRLLDAVEDNGLSMPLAIKARLSDAAAAPVALGLRRLCSLTYGPTGLARDMTRFILDAQRDDGSFDGDALVTAAAVAGLDALCRLLPDAPLFTRQVTGHDGGSGDDDPLLGASAARERAVAALVALQDADGLYGSNDDRSQDDRATTSAFIAYLLADCDAFRQSIRIADLIGHLDQHRDHLPEATVELIDLAHVTMPEAAAKSPNNLAAIAA